MKKKRLIILLLQVLIVIGFGFSFYTYVQTEINPTTVLIYNKDLPINAQVTAADLSKRTVPSSAVQSEFALDPKEIIGKYVNSRVYANNYVYAKQLTTKENIDPFDSMDLSKMRKVSLPFTYVDGFAGNLKRGDKVDLVFTGEGSKRTENGDEPYKYSKVFLQDIYVYNLNTTEGYKFKDHSIVTKFEAGEGVGGQQISTSGGQDGLGIVTLAMDLNQIEELMTRVNAGKIRVVGRFDNSTSYDTLGYVLGDFEKVFSGGANAETSIFTEEKAEK